MRQETRRRETRAGKIVTQTLRAKLPALFGALVLAGLLLVGGCARQPSPAEEFAARAFTPVPVAQGKSLAYYRPARVVSPGEHLTFTISASDADGDRLLYSVSSLPDGASFDPQTGTFSWTPRYDQAGEYTIRFEVSDGELSAWEDVTITVLAPSEDWDVNGDGAANVLDLILVSQQWERRGLTGFIREDTNEDGIINIQDLIFICQHWSG